MANSYEFKNGDGSTTDFIFSFDYISQDHIVVEVDAVATTAFTWLAAKQIRFDSAPASGSANIKIKRVTPTGALTDFIDGSTLGEADLDRVLLQALYATEEATDNIADVMRKAGSNWDAESALIKNLSNAVDNTDAVTLGQLQTILAGTVGLAAPADPGDDGKYLRANGGNYSLEAFPGVAASEISDASSNGRSLVTAANYAAMRSLLGLVIGTNVQAYDANTVKANVAATFTKGHKHEVYDNGTLSSGTHTLNVDNGLQQKATCGGSFTLAAPASGDGFFMEFLLTMDGTGGYTVTFSGFEKTINGSIDNTAGAKNLIRVTRIDSNDAVEIVQL